MYRTLKLAAVSLAAAATLAPTAASAQYYGRGGYDAPRYAQGYGRQWDNRQYRGDRYYRNDGRTYYRGNQSRNYRGGYRCDKGTGGTILGAIAGGLLGDALVGRRGDNTAGIIAGAGVGALVGRAADRNC